jgi:hypothetical protein
VANTTLNRFLAKVGKGGDCWTWTGVARGTGGYGGFRYDGRMQFAHRVSYELLVGPIPEGLVIDHLCRNRKCVNPEHLEPVTQTENMARGSAARTHCKQGHEYTPENTVPVHNGSTASRWCRICLKASKRRTYLRRKAA